MSFWDNITGKRKKLTITIEEVGKEGTGKMRMNIEGSAMTRMEIIGILETAKNQFISQVLEAQECELVKDK